MNSTNRKFVVVTATDVNKREAMKITEVSEMRLAEISTVALHLKEHGNRYDSLGAGTVDIIINCLPVSYVKLHTIDEIKVLAVIGDIKLL